MEPAPSPPCHSLDGGCLHVGRLTGALSLLCALALAALLAWPSQALAAICGPFEVTGGVQGQDYAYVPETGSLTVLTGTPLTIGMAAGCEGSASGTITVASGVSATLTLKGVTSATGAGSAAVSFPGDATCSITVLDADPLPEPEVPDPATPDPAEGAGSGGQNPPASPEQGPEQEPDPGSVPNGDKSEPSGSETSGTVPDPSVPSGTSSATSSANGPETSGTAGHAYSWQVTSAYGQGLQRYLLVDGVRASQGLYDLGNGLWTYVRPEGYVVRGRWTDPTTGYVYLADNDGRLASPGWVVSSAYGQGLQRYWVDEVAHACVPGRSGGGWDHLTTAAGYVLRGAGSYAGGKYYANNEGLLTASGWLVTSAFGQGLQRYWFADGTMAAAGLYETGDDAWSYVRPEGFVVRGRWVSPTTGYVYLADNDGVLAPVGWVVSSAYGQGLQRYWVDADAHACVPGASSDGWDHLTTAAGYVLRGGTTYAGRKYYANNDGVLAMDGWVITSAFGQGLQRYWFVDGTMAAAGFYDTGGGTRTLVTANGYVLRGGTTYAGRRYYADNDGRLAECGWLITSAFGQGLQRYWLEDFSVADAGLYETGTDVWSYVRPEGYVVRGRWKAPNGWTYLADNDGRLAGPGWVVSSAYGQALQRYWVSELGPDGALAHACIPGLNQTGDSSWCYTTAAGYVLRGTYDTGHALVYLADNDGALPSTTGWLVTAKYAGSLQRYYIDETSHAARTAYFVVDGVSYWGVAGKGYVVRNGCFESGGRWYHADNDGKGTYLPTGKWGYQNPAGYYQVSAYDVKVPQGHGIFSYATDSRISPDATREQCVEAFIARAYDYLGTKYVWDYACAPGVGVDCAGLVLQCLYAVGIDLGELNPYNHYYTPGHDQYANWMRELPGFLHVSFADRRRGDLVFWEGHVAIYLGNDQIIEANVPGVGIASVYRYGTPIAVARPFQ